MTRNKKSAALGLSLVLAASALTGCSGPAKSAKTVPATTNVPAPPAAKTTKTADVKTTTDSKESGQAVLSGKVLEVINVQSYSYLLVEKDGIKGWAAIPAADVKVGDEVELIPGIDMGKFTSATLKRTFENIHFSGGLKQGGAKAESLPQGHPMLPQAEPSLPPGHAKTAAPAPAPAGNLITGKVVETANAGGYTYLCLEKDGGKTWAAVPATEVKVGSEVSVLPGSEMTDFNSPSLKRTFPKIVFSPGIASK